MLVKAILRKKITLMVFVGKLAKQMNILIFTEIYIKVPEIEGHMFLPRGKKCNNAYKCRLISSH